MESQVTRVYSKTPKKGCDIITVDDFEASVGKKELSKFDGYGYWVKDGKESEDFVFSEPKLDATHVAWYI